LVAFARVEQGETEQGKTEQGERADRAVLVVVPRLLVRLTQSAGALHVAPPPPMPWDAAIWGDTSLDCSGLGGELTDVFTGQHLSGGGQLSVGELLGAFPVAVLTTPL
jgi:maltooligosyltrehalose synthase